MGSDPLGRERMKRYPPMEDLLRLVLRVAMPRVRRRRGGAHGGGGQKWFMRPFRVCGTLEGRSAFNALDTALRAEFRPGEASAALARRTEIGCVALQPLVYETDLSNSS